MMEQGETHAHGGKPRVGEILLPGDGLHREFRCQQGQNAVVQIWDLNCHFGIKVV